MKVKCNVSSHRQVERVKRLLSNSYSRNAVLFTKGKTVYGSTNDIEILGKLKSLKATKIIITS